MISKVITHSIHNHMVDTNTKLCDINKYDLELCTEMSKHLYNIIHDKKGFDTTKIDFNILEGDIRLSDEYLIIPFDAIDALRNKNIHLSEKILSLLVDTSVKSDTNYIQLLDIYSSIVDKIKEA